MQILNDLLPVLFSFLLGLVVYLVRAVFDLSHRVLRLEVKIEELIKRLEKMEKMFLGCDKKDT